MNAIETITICGECHKGYRVLVGSMFRWTLQCTDCGITEVISYDVKRVIVAALSQNKGNVKP